LDPSRSILPSRYDARVRYEAQFEYLGEVRSAWSPWRAAGTVAFDADGVPANLAVESYTVPVTSETEGQLVITFTVPGWNGDPRIFARIEPDPFNTDQIEILPNELTFFLPVAWGEIYDVIAFDEQGRERTILTFDLGAFEDINPLVSSLSFPDPVVQNAVDSVSAPETRVSDITFLTIGSGATSLAGLERFLWLQGLFLDDSSVTDLSPIANVWELQTLSPKYADQRYCADWGDAISWVFSILISRPVTDISPVAGLTNLIQIQVGDGDVSDLTPLANLINLETLWSQRNRVTDITPILGLTGLRILNLYQSLEPIASVAGIGTLTGLEFVDLSENPVLTTGVEELATLPNLIDVNLLGSTAIPAGDITAIETAFTGVSGFTMTRPDGSTLSQ
jgi:hypothetical protein